jgi:hypothetical protein
MRLDSSGRRVKPASQHKAIASAFNRIAAGRWTIKPSIADRLMDECAVAVRADLAPYFQESVVCVRSD